MPSTIKRFSLWNDIIISRNTKDYFADLKRVFRQPSDWDLNGNISVSHPEMSLPIVFSEFFFDRYNIKKLVEMVNVTCYQRIIWYV